MKSISIKIIPMAEMKYTTGGYWSIDKEGNCEILIARVRGWRHLAPVIFHELIEMFWCLKHGVTTEAADAFDDKYEALYKSGGFPIDKDAGDDPECPYYTGHQYGVMMERMVCFMLGLKWEEYCHEWERLYAEHV